MKIKFKLNCAIILFGLQILVSNAYSLTSTESGIKIAGTVYLKQQFELRLAGYINKNPQIFGSTDAMLGSKTLNFIGKSLAAVGFFTANNDHDRFVNAVNFFYSPEPTTALILVGVQVFESVQSAESQARIAEIEADIARLENERLKYLTSIYMNESTSMGIDFDSMSRDMLEVKKFEELVEKAKTSSLTQEQFGLILTQLVRLDDVITDYEFRIQRLKVYPKEYLSDREAFFVQVESNLASLNSLRETSKTVRQHIEKIFTNFMVEQEMENLNEDTASYASRLFLYSSCGKIVNGVEDQLVDADIVDECEKLFRGVK